MIYGVGTDICDVRRIRAAWTRRGERFAAKVLGPQELEVFHRRLALCEARGISHLATRFSAKEAFSKAIGLGLHMPMTWRACEILNAAGGKPEIRLHGALAASLDTGARTGMHVFALGPLRAERDGEPVRQWGGEKAGTRQAEARFAFLFDRGERGGSKENRLQ